MSIWKNVRQFLVLSSTLAVVASFASSGCSDAAMVAEQTAVEEEAILDGCPVGYDAQTPRPVGTCTMSLGGYAPLELGLITIASCLNDATITCSITCPCYTLGALPDSACQSGAKLFDGACPRIVESRRTTSSTSPALLHSANASEGGGGAGGTGGTGGSSAGS